MSTPPPACTGGLYVYVWPWRVCLRVSKHHLEATTSVCPLVMMRSKRLTFFPSYLAIPVDEIHEHPHSKVRNLQPHSGPQHWLEWIPSTLAAMPGAIPKSLESNRIQNRQVDLYWLKPCTGNWVAYNFTWNSNMQVSWQRISEMPYVLCMKAEA